MPRSISSVESSDPVRSLDNVGPRSDQIGPKLAKAELRGQPFNQVMRDSAIRYYGSVKETAFALGQVDPSLMMREFDAGKFGRFDEHADAQAKAFIAAALAEAYGPLSDPKARVRQLLRSIRAELDEIDQYVDVAS